MRYLFWNIRGCEHSGRRTQLKEYIARERIDIIALQEMILCGAGFPPVVIRVVFFWDVIVMYVML